LHFAGDGLCGGIVDWIGGRDEIAGRG